jgi:ABC-type enterochelin transport system ATPase subunit
MVRDGETLIGGAEQILTSKNLSRAYDCNIAVVEHGGRKLFYPC